MPLAATTDVVAGLVVEVAGDATATRTLVAGLATACAPAPTGAVLFATLAFATSDVFRACPAFEAGAAAVTAGAAMARLDARGVAGTVAPPWAGEAVVFDGRNPNPFAGKEDRTPGPDARPFDRLPGPHAGKFATPAFGTLSGAAHGASRGWIPAAGRAVAPGVLLDGKKPKLLAGAEVRTALPPNRASSLPCGCVCAVAPPTLVMLADLMPGFGKSAEPGMPGDGNLKVWAAEVRASLPPSRAPYLPSPIACVALPISALDMPVAKVAACGMATEEFPPVPFFEPAGSKAFDPGRALTRASARPVPGSAHQPIPLPSQPVRSETTTNRAKKPTGRKGEQMGSIKVLLHVKTSSGKRQTVGTIKPE